jgi:Major Facilitator Superfamily
VLAALATSAVMLIATRAVLGVAGATLAPSTLSLIRNMFLDARQRTAAIAVWGASFSAGAAIGPLVGGVLLSRFWWRSVFLVAATTLHSRVRSPTKLAIVEGGTRTWTSTMCPNTSSGQSRRPPRSSRSTGVKPVAHTEVHARVCEGSPRHTRGPEPAGAEWHEC